jgi:hypothetical protein
MSDNPTPSALKRRPVVRAVMVLLALVTAFHVFAQFLWIAPASQLRVLIPGDFLTSWQIPFFGQSWSVFAPDPINGNYVFKVRALVPDRSGETVQTQWIDATDAEYAAAEHHLLPPRGASLASEQATKYKSAWDALNEDQRAVVADHYWKGADWKVRFENALLAASGDDDDAVAHANAFITANAFTDAYATQVARAAWGDDVRSVQFDIYRQNVTPFAQRHEQDPEPQPKQTTPTGWRGLFVMPEQSQDDFAATFDRWLDASGQHEKTEVR